MPSFVMLIGDKEIDMTPDVKKAKTKKEIKLSLKKALKKGLTK